MAQPMAQLMANRWHNQWHSQWQTRSKRLTGWPAGEDGNLYNSRLEYERDKQVAYRNEKSKAGTAGAEKRWNATRHIINTDSTANGKPMAQPMANDSGSVSSSFSSSFPCAKEKDACSVSENLPPITRKDENAIAERTWELLEKIDGGRGILAGAANKIRPALGIGKEKDGAA
jgi:hypothetical protein